MIKTEERINEMMVNYDGGTPKTVKNFVVCYSRTDDIQLIVTAEDEESARDKADCAIDNMTREEFENIVQKGYLEHYDTFETDKEEGESIYTKKDTKTLDYNNTGFVGGSTTT